MLTGEKLLKKNLNEEAYGHTKASFVDIKCQIFFFNVNCVINVDSPNCHPLHLK